MEAVTPKTSATPSALDTRLALALGLSLASILSLPFPGDAPWINDEPKFVMLAYQANATGTLATQALVGSQGVSYGPAAVWFYQLLLGATHDPVVLVILHALLMSGLTAIALYWLSRELGLWPLFAAMVAFSPYLWFYNRLLWDNSLNIPLSALALAAYLAFVARGSRAALLLTLGCLLIAPLIHLMSLALVAAVATHMAVYTRRALWRHRVLLLSVLFGGAVLYSGYARVLLAEIGAGHLRTGIGGLSIGGFTLPLLGARIISASGLHYFFGPGWGSSLPLVLVRGFSALSFPFVWGGMAIAVQRLRGLGRGTTPCLVDHAAIVSLVIVAAQMLLDGVTAAEVHPHYFNATWIAYVVLAWLAADWLAARRRWRWLVLAYGGSLVVATVWLLALMHVTGGNRETHYGPTLANQMEVAAQLSRAGAGCTWTTDVPHYREYPHTLAALQTLRPLPEDQTLPARALVIRYASSDPHDGRVVVTTR